MPSGRRTPRSSYPRSRVDWGRSRGCCGDSPSPTTKDAKRVEAFYELELLEPRVAAARARTVGRSRRPRPASPRGRAAARAPGGVSGGPRARGSPGGTGALGATGMDRRGPCLDRARGRAPGPHLHRDRAGEALEHLLDPARPYRRPEPVLQGAGATAALRAGGGGHRQARRTVPRLRSGAARTRA